MYRCFYECIYVNYVFICVFTCDHISICEYVAIATIYKLSQASTIYLM